MRSLILIAHNLRSSHNVGSLLRTAEGLGVEAVYLTGYTPYPIGKKDNRLPHLAKKTHSQITKTSLDAENLVPWHHEENINNVFKDLRRHGYTIAAVEQSKNSVRPDQFEPPDKLALVLGREVQGLEPEVLNACDHVIEIPMLGKKESFNVVQAAAMVLYHFRFIV